MNASSEFNGLSDASCYFEVFARLAMNLTACLRLNCNGTTAGETFARQVVGQPDTQRKQSCRRATRNTKLRAHLRYAALSYEPSGGRGGPHPANFHLRLAGAFGISRRGAPFHLAVQNRLSRIYSLAAGEEGIHYPRRCRTIT